MDSPVSHASPHQNSQPDTNSGKDSPDEPCVQDEVDRDLLKYVLDHSLSREDACWYLGISENTLRKRCHEHHLAFTGLYRGRRLTQKEMADGFRRSRNLPTSEQMKRMLSNNAQLTVAVVGDEGYPVLLEHFQLVPRPLS